MRNIATDPPEVAMRIMLATAERADQLKAEAGERLLGARRKNRCWPYSPLVISLSALRLRQRSRPAGPTSSGQGAQDLCSAGMARDEMFGRMPQPRASFRSVRVYAAGRNRGRGPKASLSHLYLRIKSYRWSAAATPCRSHCSTSSIGIPVSNVCFKVVCRSLLRRWI